MHSAQELLRRHGIEYKPTRNGKFTTNCPECGGGYLSVETKRGFVVWYCHRCKWGGPEKSDEQLNEIIEQLKELGKEEKVSVDEDAEIKRLAQLKRTQYERERKAAAERLGIRAAILDKLVQAERPDDENKQGRAISLPEPELWPESVDGTALLDRLAETIGRYVVMPEHSRDTAALWVVHSYLLDCFLVSPRLAVCSPAKQCGKTTLLDVLGCLVLKPLPTANVTASAIFRVYRGPPAHGPGRRGGHLPPQ